MPERSPGAEPRIDWHGVPRSQALEAYIRDEAARLAGAFPGVHVKQVRLESMDPRGSLTGPVCASTEVRAAQRQIIVNREHADAEGAVREGFEVIFRALDRRQERERRTHEALVA
jgi:sigma 54 modulation/S30EA-like ribosomal protein